MTEYDVIDRLSTRLRSDPRALFQLMDEYLRPDTTAEQDAYIRELVAPLRADLSGERHAPLWNALAPVEHVRRLLAYISMVDGLPGVDPSDDTLMLNNLVNRARGAGVDLHILLGDMRAISAQGALKVFRSIEDKAGRMGRGGSTSMMNAVTYRPMTARERAAADTSLPHRYRSTPVIRMIVSAIIVTGVGLIMIGEGGDAQMVAAIVTVFLIASAVLYYVFYNAERPWPK